LKDSDLKVGMYIFYGDFLCGKFEGKGIQAGIGKLVEPPKSHRFKIEKLRISKGIMRWSDGTPVRDSGSMILNHPCTSLSNVEIVSKEQVLQRLRLLKSK